LLFDQINSFGLRQNTRNFEKANLHNGVDSVFQTNFLGDLKGINIIDL